MKRAAWGIVALLLVLAPSPAPAQLDSATRARSLIGSVPLELAGNRILIQVTVDSSGPLTYVFDTGAGGTMMSARTARRLGIQATDTVERQGFAGAFAVVRSPGHTVRVGSLRLDDVALAIADLAHIERAEGRRLDGVIGWHLLSRYAVRIDIDSSRLEFYDNQRFTYSLGENGLDVDRRGTGILVRAAVTLEDGARITSPVLLDTGSPRTVLFTAAFARANNLLNRVPGLCDASAAGASAERVPVRTVMLRGFEIGAYETGPIPAGVVVPGPGDATTAGAMGPLGMDVLGRFNLFIDVRHRRVFLEPNGLPHRPVGANCSGLRLETDSTFGRVLVAEVYEGSPARAAGLEPGDEIVRVGGRRASGLALWEIRRALSGDWAELDLVVSRRGEPRTVTLRRTE